MIKILILEDSNKKATEIANIILKIESISLEDIKTVSDIVSAKAEMKVNKYDLLILDIQIPTRFDLYPDPQGGIKFLKEIVNSDNYCRPAHIIGITAYEDSRKLAQDEFGKYLWDVLDYSEVSYNWSLQLGNKIKYLVSSYQALQENPPAGSRIDYAILCALDDVELEAVKNVSDEWTSVEIINDSTNYYRCTFKNNDKIVTAIVAATCEMGMSASGVLATKLIYSFRPKYLIMCGILAGVKSKVNIGDILIIDPSFDYGNGKYLEVAGETIFMPDPKQIRVEADLVRKIKSFISEEDHLFQIKKSWMGDKPATELKVHIGLVGSGSAVVANTTMIESIIRNNRKLIGVEMETYAVYLAANNCTRPKPNVVSIKSVSDYADSEKNDGFQKYAAHTSAKFIRELILSQL